MTIWMRLVMLLLSILPCVLFLINFVAWTTGDLTRLSKWRRYGEDMSVATTDYLEHIEPTHRPAVTLSDEAAKIYMQNLQRFIQKMVARHQIRPWEFWRTLRRNPHHRPGRVSHRMNDDIGRSWLAAGGFRLLGGVAPFLLLWLAALLCVPVLIWIVWEFAKADHLTSGFVLASLFACSPFFVESMATPYVAIGFYFVALLVIVALAVSLVMGKNRSVVLFAMRAFVAGLILAVCAVCRNGTLMLLPGLLLALGLGARRLLREQKPPQDELLARAEGRSWRRSLWFLVGVILLIAPYLVIRPAKQHEVWLGVWQGLGDFDRTKGHVWADHIALAVFLEAGFDRDVPRDVPIYERNVGAPEREAFFRSRVLANVRSDPAWYLGILVQRLLVTVTQSKLLEFGDGRDPVTTPPPTPNEGKIRFYYSRVTAANRMGFVNYRGVIPLPVYWIVGLAFLLGVALDRRNPQSRAALLTALCAGLAILVLPVLITTAGAFETQAFILVYFLAVAFLTERAVKITWRAMIAVRRRMAQSEASAIWS